MYSMFIKELNLKSFGKFLHKQVILKNGLNLVYGNNEAGKSTIHNFIEVMLYGFKDKNNNYNESAYKRFRPWFYDQYLGSLTLEDDDKNIDYIIKKDFLTKETEFLQKNRQTEEESRVKDCIENFEAGEYLLGIDKSMYSNTLSIKQLGNSTNEELAFEVKQKILNLSQTKDEIISVESIIKKLNSIRDEAGDIDNPKSLINQYKSRVQELEELKSKALDARKYTLHLAMEKKKLVNKIAQIDYQISEINNELENYRMFLLVSKKEKADEVYEEINNIKNELLQYGEGNNIGIDDYEEALKLITLLNQMKQEKTSIEEEMTQINREMVKLENDPSCSIAADGFVVKINLDYKSYKEADEKIKKLQEKVNSGMEQLKSYNTDEIAEYTEAFDEVLKNEQKISRTRSIINNSSKELVKSLIKSNNIGKIISICFAILTILIACGSAFAGYYFNVLEYYIGSFSIIISIILFILANKKSKKIKGLKKELIEIDDEKNRLEKELTELVKKNEDIYKSKSCLNIDELRKKSEYYISLKTIVEEKIKLLEFDKESLKSAEKTQKLLYDDILNKLANFSIEELSDESVKKVNEIVLEKDKIVQELKKKSILLDKLEQNHRKIEKELDYEEKRFNIILTSNNIKNIDEFKTIVNNNYKITQLKDKIEGLNRVIDNILEDYTYEQICQLTKSFIENHEQNDSLQKINKEEKLKEIQLKEEEKASVRKEIGKIDDEIDSIENMSRRLVEIEEEIDFYQEKIVQSEEKIKIANIAIENILLISNYIKGDFLPLLKNAIAENFSYVTGGKYNDVIIDEDMNISVISAENGDVININSLSGGTLDQLYISLRLGLSYLISENKKIPLILDDSFIQYDEVRLKKSLEILNKEAHRRQVILFTCQKREMEILKELQIEYNLIKIS